MLSSKLGPSCNIPLTSVESSPNLPALLAVAELKSALLNAKGFSKIFASREEDSPILAEPLRAFMLCSKPSSNLAKLKVALATCWSILENSLLKLIESSLADLLRSSKALVLMLILICSLAFSAAARATKSATSAELPPAFWIFCIALCTATSANTKFSENLRRLGSFINSS